jgi:hypothetical protein
LIMFKLSHDILDLIKGQFQPFSAITSNFWVHFQNILCMNVRL